MVNNLFSGSTAGTTSGCSTRNCATRHPAATRVGWSRPKPSAGKSWFARRVPLLAQHRAGKDALILTSCYF